MLKLSVKEQVIQKVNTDFKTAVIEGLTMRPKKLPSMFFYDETGDLLFQKIMKLPEYYPTRCEAEILEKYKDVLLSYFTTPENSFRLTELGAGDGAKTRILIKHFLSKGAQFTYSPVDISEHVLELITGRFNREFPSLKQEPVACDYFEALGKIRNDSVRNIILFLGANIGNFTRHEAAGFLSKLADKMGESDLILAGFDLKKDPAVIYAAYNDRQGITKAFNFNLLHRINKELGGDFKDENFMHYPAYDPESGEMKSYLVAAKTHDVKITDADKTFSFKAWEPVFTEVSCKYGYEDLFELTRQSGLEIIKIFTDARNYYANVLIKKARK